MKAARRNWHLRAPLVDAPCIDDNRFLFIGGLHRSGTSIIHRLLRDHPAASGFAQTGVPEDEGQHLQTVFAPAYATGGPGAFAFDPRSHLTEESPLITPENREKLLREWGAYYQLDRKILLEKSPPNVVRSRFFQALFPGAAFLFIVRHPVAVALATKKWSKATVTELLLHWYVAYSIMLMDRVHLRRYKVMRYEDMVESPQPCLDEVCDLAGIERFVPKETIVNHNPKYFTPWAREYAEERKIVESVFPAGQGPMETFGYSFSEPYVGRSPALGKLVHIGLTHCA